MILVMQIIDHRMRATKRMTAATCGQTLAAPTTI
jgi:hypothetical protein